MLLVAAVGTASLLGPSLGAASGAAIALSAITMPTNPEHGVACVATANPLTENRFAMNRHAARGAAMDKGNRLWQVRTSFAAW